MCIGYGHCAIGCPTGAKWDTRELIPEAVMNGAELIKDCRVTGLTISGQKAESVTAVHRGRRKHSKQIFSSWQQEDWVHRSFWNTQVSIVIRHYLLIRCSVLPVIFPAFIRNSRS